MQYLPRTNSKSPWLRYDEVVPKIMTADNFRQMKCRGDIRVHIEHGVKYLEYDFAGMDKKYRDAIVKQFGDPAAYIAMQPLKALVKTDVAARKYYIEKYRLPDGRSLPLEYQLMYSRQADWFGAIKIALTDKAQTKQMLGISIEQLWKNWSMLINNDEAQHDGEQDMTVAHGLPGSVDRLKRRYKLFAEKGYAGIIEAFRFGNSNAKKVTGGMERLLISLYCQPYKPSMAEVCRDFRLFQAGKKQVVDVESAEVYEPADFMAKGKPYMIGESTVDYYIKKPANQVVINKGRMKALDYNTTYRPSVKRIAPMCAFSKITMDDIDLPFKGPDGDRVVKSYQIFDVCSGAVIGVAFSKDKNVELIREALRDMFRLIIEKGWGMPGEIEFEKHLTSAMTGKMQKNDTAGTWLQTGDKEYEWSDEEKVFMADVLTPGAVFPFTRICLGGNAKEKRAEGFIRVKKYGQQKKRPGFQGRFYARLLTNRLNTDQKQLRFEYETIVDNEIADIAAHNAELHPKQDLYPGMSRWQVLEEQQNPNLPKFQANQAIQYIGYSTSTTIRAGVARVQYGDYALPEWEVMKGLHYAGEITAYYLPDGNGQVPSVYLFENNRFLCECKKLVGFQEAIVEQTEADKEIMQRQFARQASYDKMVREGQAQIAQVAMAQMAPVKVTKPRAVKTVKAAEAQVAPAIDARALALMDI